MLKPDREIFDFVVEDFCIRLPVELVLHPTPPPQAIKVLEGGLAESMKIDNFDPSGLTGLYRPNGKLVGDSPTLVGHAIWIRNTQDSVRGSISFIHELVHASQTENYGIEEMARSSNEWMASFGYDGNPIEIEAEAIARYYVYQKGCLILKEEEYA